MPPVVEHRVHVYICGGDTHKLNGMNKVTQILHITGYDLFYTLGILIMGNIQVKSQKQ